MATEPISNPAVKLTPEFVAAVATAVAQAIAQYESGRQTTAENNSRLVDIDELIVPGGALGNSPFSKRKVLDLTRRGIIPHYRIGHQLRFSPALVRAALDQNCLIASKLLKRGQARKAAAAEVSANV